MTYPIVSALAVVMQPKILNITRTAQHIGVSRKTLYNWLKSGTFAVQPLEGRKPPKFAVDDLDAWLKANKS